MAIFDYDNYVGNRLKIRFRCRRCGEINETENYEIPFMDEKASYEHTCGRCDMIHEIHLIDDGVNGHGEIIDLPNSKILNVITIPYEYYSNMDLSLIHRIIGTCKIETCLEEIEILSENTRSFIYQMLMVNVISLLETYLKESITRKIMECDEYKKNLIENHTSTNVDKKTMNKVNDLDVQDVLRSISFQNMDNVKKILKKVFRIYINKCEFIQNAINKRNIIVHRNGIDETGNDCLVEKSELLNLLGEIRCFTNDLNEKFNDIETNK
ncbi:MAG: hypothetical protein IKX24_00740 [Prevotella sp.]|nr:hypothetical protein [Prevotella sp.]